MDNRPEWWTIHYLYSYYMGSMNELEREYKEKQISYDKYDETRKRINNDYVQAMKLVFTNKHYSYGLLIPAPAFAKAWIDGDYCDYDGIGYFVDWDGNEICPLNWKKYTDEVRFVAWYNK